MRKKAKVKDMKTLFMMHLLHYNSVLSANEKFPGFAKSL
jgi:hypothetical protein